MSRPPMLMHIKIHNDRTDFGLWLPLILIAIVALAVIIVLSPLIILAFIIMLMVGMERWVRFTLLSLWAVNIALWSMRGLEINVENARDRVIVSVI